MRKVSISLPQDFIQIHPTIEIYRTKGLTIQNLTTQVRITVHNLLNDMGNHVIAQKIPSTLGILDLRTTASHDVTLEGLLSSKWTKIWFYIFV